MSGKSFFMVDLVIVVLYLVLTFVVGIFAGRNVKTMKDFSVSSKIFPTSVAYIKTCLVGVTAEFVFIVMFRCFVPEDYAAISQVMRVVVAFFLMFVLEKCFRIVMHLYDSDLVVSRD